MSEESDPGTIRDALVAATDAFNEEGHGIPTREEPIDADADWKTQLTKGCRLLAAVKRLSGAGLYTATSELCFGATERSVEAFALAEGADELPRIRIPTPAAEILNRRVVRGDLILPHSRNI